MSLSCLRAEIGRTLHSIVFIDFSITVSRVVLSLTFCYRWASLRLTFFSPIKIHFVFIPSTCRPVGLLFYMYYAFRPFVFVMHSYQLVLLRVGLRKYWPLTVYIYMTHLLSSVDLSTLLPICPFPSIHCLKNQYNWYPRNFETYILK